MKQSAHANSCFNLCQCWKNFQAGIEEAKMQQLSSQIINSAGANDSIRSQIGSEGLQLSRQQRELTRRQNLVYTSAILHETNETLRFKDLHTKEPLRSDFQQSFQKNQAPFQISAERDHSASHQPRISSQLNHSGSQLSRQRPNPQQYNSRLQPLQPETIHGVQPSRIPEQSALFLKKKSSQISQRSIISVERNDEDRPHPQKTLADQDLPNQREERKSQSNQESSQSIEQYDQIEKEDSERKKSSKQNEIKKIANICFKSFNSINKEYKGIFYRMI